MYCNAHKDSCNTFEARCNSTKEDVYKRQSIDCVNSVGCIILPELLERLGVKHVEKLYCEATGDWQHNPEPLEKNLGDIMGLMAKGGCDVAFVVDPDVDVYKRQE